ncbi:hypothetical protein [Trinickia fusca]|uniref:hypothetical protein n=1 Tax=Trinickia fusca TaxID=2419777 RepID=UPI0011C37954|nr:hypothetical protein [Trinickia fusca]
MSRLLQRANTLAAWVGAAGMLAALGMLGACAAGPDSDYVKPTATTASTPKTAEPENDAQPGAPNTAPAPAPATPTPNPAQSHG